MHSGAIDPLSVGFFAIFIASLIFSEYNKRRINVGREKKDKIAKATVAVTAVSLFLAILFGNQDALHKGLAGVLLIVLWYLGIRTINRRT